MTAQAIDGAHGADTLDAHELDRLQQRAGDVALRARERIEQAVELGALPRWVLDTCNEWEQASVAYGAVMRRRGNSGPMLERSPLRTRH